MRTIKEEILRIKEIMSLKQLITEGVADDVVKWFDEAIELLAKAKPEGRSATEQLFYVGDTLIGDKTAKESFETALQQAKQVDPRTGVIFGTRAFNTNQKTIFYSILKNTKIKVGETEMKFSDSVFKSIINTYKKKSNKPNISEAEAEMEWLKDIYEKLKSRYPTKDSFTSQQIRAELVSLYNDDVAEMVLDIVQPKMEIVPKIIEDSANAAKKIANKEISLNAAKILGSPSGQAFLQVEFLRFYSRLIGSVRKPNAELEKRLMDLNELVSYKIMNNMEYQDELRAMADTISLMNPGQGQSGSDLSSLFKQYLTENPVVKEWGDKTLKEVLDNDPVIQFMAENASKDLAKYGRDMFKIRLKGIFGVMPKNMAIASESYIDTAVKRFTTKIVTGSQVLPEEVQAYIARYGRSSYLLSRLKGMALVNFLIVPTLFGLADTLWQAIELRKENDKMQKLRKSFCPGGDMEILSAEECNELFKETDINDATNFFNSFLKYQPFIINIFQEESKDIIPFTDLDAIFRFVGETYMQVVGTQEGLTSDFFLNYLFESIKSNPALSIYAYDPSKDFEENYIIVRNKLYEERLPKPVVTWLNNTEYNQDGDETNNWFGFKPIDYESSPKSYETRFIDNSTGEELLESSENSTTVYRKLSAGEKWIGKPLDKTKKFAIKVKFNWLFNKDNITKSPMYDETFGKEGFVWGKDEEGSIFFQIKRANSDIIDKINKLEQEGDTWVRQGDTTEFTKERAEELVSGYEEPAEGDIIERDSLTAKKLGIEKQLRNSKYSNITFYYVDNETIKYDEPSTGRTGEIKKIEDKWYWQFEGYGEKDYLFESKKQKITNMKTINESIREKLTSKYIDKAKKIIKISENLEKVSGDFYNKNYTKFFNKMFSLSESFRSSKLYLVESTEGNFEIAFTKLFKGDEERVKNKLTNYLSSQLKLTDEMKMSLEEKMKNVEPSEIYQFFTDSDKLTSLIAEVIVDSAKDADSEDSVESIVQNVAVPYFKTVDFKENLKRKLKSKIDEKMVTLKGKVEQMVKDIIKAVAEKEESKS